MPLPLNEHQFKAVVALPAKERYGHFIKRVADSQEAWGLGSEGDWSLTSEADQIAFPLWPHPAYAEACATDAWSEASPESLSLEELMNILERLDADGLAVSVFPTPQGTGVVVTPTELRQHLEAELENY